MYVYFLPLAGGPTSSSADSGNASAGSDAKVLPATHHEIVIPPPTSDGGLEHTAAQFLHASSW